MASLPRSLALTVLGVRLDPTVRASETALQHRMRSAWRSDQGKRAALASRAVSRRLRMKLLDEIVFQTLAYGLCCFDLRRCHMEAIRRVQSEMVMRAAGIFRDGAESWGQFNERRRIMAAAYRREADRGRRGRLVMTRFVQWAGTCRRVYRASHPPSCFTAGLYKAKLFGLWAQITKDTDFALASGLVGKMGSTVTLSATLLTGGA